VHEIINPKQVPAAQNAGDVNRSEVCSMEKKGWLKGGFAMAICCAAPLLLIAAVTLFVVSLGVLANGFLSLAALLACPVAMYLMMRMITKDKT
jgi:hypothetical protein